MSAAEWEEAYAAAWAAYYTPEHMIRFEGVHPLEGGAFRLKFRRDRRHGMPLESSLVFYPRYAIETLRKAWLYYCTWHSARRTLRQVLRNPERMAYTDLAISPTVEEEYASLDLYSA